MNDVSEGEISTMNHTDCECYVPPYNVFSQIKQDGGETQRQGNLGDKLTPTFDKAMTAQEAVMDNQRGSCFHILLKTYLMNPNPGSDR